MDFHRCCKLVHKTSRNVYRLLHQRICQYNNQIGIITMIFCIKQQHLYFIYFLEEQNSTKQLSRRIKICSFKDSVNCL